MNGATSSRTEPIPDDVAIAAADPLEAPRAGAAALRGSGVRVGAYVAGVLLSVVSAALLFRYLGVRESGRYVTVVTIVSIAQGLPESGLSALAMRELSMRVADRRSLMRDLLGLRLVLTLLGISGAVAFAAVA